MGRNCGEPRKAWVIICWWCGHRHIKDPCASDPRMWQSLLQVRLMMAKPFSTHECTCWQCVQEMSTLAFSPAYNLKAVLSTERFPYWDWLNLPPCWLYLITLFLFSAICNNPIPLSSCMQQTPGGSRMFWLLHLRAQTMRSHLLCVSVTFLNFSSPLVRVLGLKPCKDLARNKWGHV